MPVRVSVSVSGVEEVLDKIAGLEERLADVTPALEIIADLLELFVAAQFASQGSQGGVHWAPLAFRTTVLRLERRGYYARTPTGGAGPQGPILVWTGRLRDSFKRGAAEHVRLISRDGLEWGTQVPYAGFHQSPLARTRLPRRPMVSFRDSFQQRELAFQPLRLWLQGVPAGAIKTVLIARLGLGAAA